MKSLIFLFASLSIVLCAQQSYEGHVVLEMVPQNQEHLQFLKGLDEGGLFDFWVRPGKVGVKVHIRLSPTQFSYFKHFASTYKLEYKVLVENLQKMINIEKLSMSSGFLRFGGSQRSSPVGTYARHAAINAWLDTVAASYDFATVETIGSSTENRAMKMIKIGNGGSSKPSVWLDAGIHAREWITVSSMLYIIDTLVKGYKSNDREIKALVDHFDFYILPVANPDGYEYSHTRSRMWRKTRSRQASSWGGTCWGVDPNRNWKDGFGGASTSTNPCSDIYPGTAAFSEPETTAMRNKMQSLGSKLKAYIAVHSYSQLWLTPWGYTSERPTDDAEMTRVAQIGADALKKINGRSFRVGAPPRILYAAGGGAYDYVKKTLGVKYSYTLELFPSRSSKYYNGFIVPATEIGPAAKETWAGIKATFEEIARPKN